ncbi:hypothetical protein [Maledivibacter halophilus]|uniref:Uncharacterized protein n=1 Tax=Maledivibacter halophilus TaxID=36842 RepID=A0A1T5JT17_9FIRM|nr:hypothetical protein [Maledivibacter halophilus]SKC54504.1 hypothetical protein SAMN02194393_01309 [Maledivibacter halophilus]
MKRSADLLINGEYKRINIWDVIHWKTFETEYWERNKDNFYSTYNANFKEKMTFVLGKNGVLSKSHFRYKSNKSNRIHEGYEESYRHEFFKECISRLEVINIKVKGQPVKIYIDKSVQEEVVYTSKTKYRVVDVMVYFTKSEPAIYYEKWAGKLAIEIYYSYKVDELKIKEFRDLEIPIIEFNAKNWKYIKEDFKTQEEEEKQYKNIVSKLNNTLYVSILVDPISKEYLISEKINELDAQNRELKEQLRLATINEKKKLSELSFF